MKRHNELYTRTNRQTVQKIIKEFGESEFIDKVFWDYGVNRIDISKWKSWLNSDFIKNWKTLVQSKMKSIIDYEGEEYADDDEDIIRDIFNDLFYTKEFSKPQQNAITIGKIKHDEIIDFYQTL